MIWKQRTYLGHALNDRLINHPRRSLDVVQPRRMHRNLLRHLRIRAVPPIAESMVEERALLLLSCAWDAGNVQDRNHLGEGTCNSVGGGEFTDTESCGQDTERVGLDASIAVGGVSSVKFVAVADPVNVGVVFNQILQTREIVRKHPQTNLQGSTNQEAKVEVSWDAEHMLGAG